MRWIRLAGHVLAWVVLGVAVAVLAAVVLVPRVMGWVPLTVLSGSMEPTITTGSQVVVEPVRGPAEVAALEVGDVITVMPRPEDPTLVTHRVVTKRWGADGSVVLTTQGDANATEDPWRLTSTQVRGRVLYHVPYVGYLAQTLDADQRDRAALLVAVALLCYAGWQLTHAVRDRRARPARVPLAQRAPQDTGGEFPERRVPRMSR